MRGKLLFFLGCLLSAGAASAGGAFATDDVIGKQPTRPPLTAYLVEELESWEGLKEKERSRALEPLPSMAPGLSVTSSHRPLRPPTNS